MNKLLRVPEGLTSPPYNQRSIQFHGFTAVESCTHSFGKSGSMFLEDPVLLIVLQGFYTVNYGRQSYEIKKNEMVLLKKSIAVDYKKSGDPENDNLFEYMLFFLKDEFLQEFIKYANMTIVRPEELIPISVKTVDSRMLGFIDSIRPYFTESESIDAGLIKLKMLELLYSISSKDSNLLGQMIQLKQQARRDIKDVLEDNYRNPVSISDLAYLSGRSLASFKRDFHEIYNVSPSEWIRKKRLQKAKELLINTDMSVTDICYSVGLENVTHFSRIFKKHFNISPSSFRNNPNG
ncbi:AraC family transcriptional regulator [Oscillospiraceae bacterium WX1]